jgi:predicted nucleotide-binding protein
MLSEVRAKSEHLALGAELRELARRGFGQPDLVELDHFPAILAATGLSAQDAGPRAAALYSVLTGAITQLSPSDREATRLLSGLDPRSKGQSLGERRRLAAESLGVAIDTFRTHRESKLGEQLARALLVHVAAETPSRRVESDPARIFVIHSHGDPAYEALVALLRSLGLAPVDASTLIAPGELRVMDVFRSALENSAAVIALLTPDATSHTEASPRRPTRNVLLELGLALGLAPTKTIVVAAGPVDLPSDLAGIHVIRPGNDTAGRDALRTRLRLLGRPLADDHFDWLDPAIAGDFDRRPGQPLRTRVDARAVGDLIGDRYELIQRFGTGFSRREVWAARDRFSHERMVLTFWPTDPPETPQAIRQSIGTRAEFEHPGVVPIRDVLAGEDHVVVVSDVVDGVSLASTGRLSAAAAVKVLAGVLDALTALHAHGVVHADLKPENILIARGGRPVLIDFGLAWRAESEPDQTSSVGTLPAERPQAGDDVQAAGQVLLSLLGASPTPGRNGSPEDAISRLDVSPQLKEALRRSLAADPAERPSASEFLSALRAAPEATGHTSDT